MSSEVPLVSYVISRFPVPVSVFSTIEAALAALNAEQRKFLLHVLVSNLINLNKVRHRGAAGWLEVSIDLPCQWVEEHFGRNFKPADIDSRLLVITPAHPGQCRSYKAAEHLLDTVLGWTPSGSSEAIVNVFDGTPYEVRTPTEWEDGIFSSKIVRQAIGTFESCPFNDKSLNTHLAELEAWVHGTADPDKREARRLRLENDRACALRIRSGCAPVKDGFSSYVPEFRTSKTGRIIEVGGGSQSCSREMKVAIFKDVPDLQNYDLKRAQAFILLQELEDARLPRDWVERYVYENDANQRRADALGMSKDAYKACVYATIMGATHSKLFVPDRNDIYRALLRECHGDADRAKSLTKNVYGALGPLKEEVEAWHRYLMTSSVCGHLDPARKKFRTLKNACGQHFTGEEYRKQDVGRKAAAFILQGQEAAFIHHLTVLGASSGFTPISNQHDGLVVIGEIPQAAVDQAAKASGIRYAIMEEKAFV